MRGCGPKPETFSAVDGHTNMPSNSGVLALLCCGAWYFYFYAANLTKPVFGIFSFDSSELPIITIYAIYIPIFVMFIIKEGKKDIFKNIVMPILGLLASLFMVFVAVYAHGIKPYLAAAEKGEFGQYHVIGKGMTPDFLVTSFWPNEEACRKNYHPGALKYFDERGITLKSVSDSYKK